MLAVNKKSEVLSANTIIEKLFEKATLSPVLPDIIKNATNILIILPDITRKCGAKKFLKNIISLIKENNKVFSIIFATGTHRSLEYSEMTYIIGEEVFEEEKQHIIKHTSEDLKNHIYYGKTKHGTPVLLNKAFFDNDTIIIISAVSYHYFAGFGGGKKLILPGIAATSAVINNHKLVLDEVRKCRNPLATTGNIKLNPVNDDIIEAVIMATKNKTIFAINTIIDSNGNIVDLTCGELFISHINLCNRLKEITSFEVTDKYNILFVSCGGFPADINMIQAQKSLNRVENIVNDGGIIFFFARCRDGFGNDYFKDFFKYKSSKEMFKALLEDYKINRQTAYSLKINTERFKVYLYSDFTEKESLQMGFKKLRKIEDISTFDFKGEKAGIVPEAYNSYFSLDKLSDSSDS